MSALLTSELTSRYVTVNAVQQTILAPPRVSVTLGRRLYTNTTGFLSA